MASLSLIDHCVTKYIASLSLIDHCVTKYMASLSPINHCVTKYMASLSLIDHRVTKYMAQLSLIDHCVTKCMASLSLIDHYITIMLVLPAVVPENYPLCESTEQSAPSTGIALSMISKWPIIMWFDLRQVCRTTTYLKDRGSPSCNFSALAALPLASVNYLMVHYLGIR